MIHVAFTPQSVKVSGHGGTAPRGQDVVCAAVSALVQALVLGLDEIARCDVSVERLEPGDVAAQWPPLSGNDAARAILATAAASLQEIAGRNPDAVRVTGAVEILNEYHAAEA